ncbi:MAG: efflux RND transporter periplasmic adaptor subunit [Methylococcaceae bacterium]|jgi:cobalt-zinc-cadmium efflux system membrane fusion protein|nr:efflux RND transporter periplasmic adaptor subunit [Methylococcaceae bacterium]MDP2393012.1 efflux RND transporter periplasmic adaptor subunit [Methylococcaceae bacterium]MDP3020496.1 efflux RND transporter periplasmic adaptor subunit [Methylococcaceae bacterium]MDP3389859.1 efflux RND transporter periplasmic adaptor subunit [Methylococcaceae bacterium]MDP3933479.1 efflux RND transporter periplasmic adaptor subunit [Methylococcaceae bacterium]
MNLKTLSIPQCAKIQLLALCLLASNQVMALENSIQLSEANFTNLGIKLGKLEPVKQIPVLYAPAKVVAPPSQEYTIAASQAGLITKLNAAIGDNIKKGDVLAQLDSPELLSMQRLYLKAVSDLQLSALTYQRDKKLLADGAIAERRWQETASQHNAFASEADEHRQLLTIAGMSAGEIDRLTKTHKLSGQLNIHAPINGVIIDRMAEAGSRIDILSPIYRLANLDELWLELNIPQERIDSVKLGDKVLIENTSDAVTAEIRLLGQSVNPKNQTVHARAVIKGPQSAVRVGQQVNIQIIQNTDKAAYKVANVAIAQNDGGSFVFVRTANGFQVLPVKVLGKQGDESIISGNFTGSEQLAIQGAVALKANWLGLGSGE